MKENGQQASWTSIIKRWEKSGKSQRAFCQSEHLSFWSFRNWKSKLAKAHNEKGTMGIVEIPIRKTERSRNSDMVRIVLPCGIAIEIGSEASNDRIETLLRIARSV